MKLNDAVNSFVVDKVDYYKQWIYDEPIIISYKHHQKLVKLHQVMHKLVKEFVINYQQYNHLMPVSNDVQRVLTIFDSTPYKPGTYRTDFVYDSNNQVKLIEITCRFALNTQFLNAIFNSVANNYHRKKLNELQTVDLFQHLYPYLETFYKDSETIYILKGSDLKNESIIFKHIFREAGKTVIEIDYKDIESTLHKLENAWIISELTLDEIISLSNTSLKTLSESNLINDFRTIFLIHDKRFFHVLGDEELQKNVLSLEEIDFFKDYYIPTYGRKDREDLWNKARLNKDNWILKHRALGKSKSVYAGPVTTAEEWENLFNQHDLSDFVLQEWIPQKKVQGNIGQVKYDDYITGTLLFFNEHYFGLGPFRLSSYPVTNVVDDRKACSLVLDKEQDYDPNSFSIYID